MIKFCTRCGAGVSLEIPAGDTLPRHVCKRCGHIHYENPRLVVGCVAKWQGCILLCRRAIEPQRGLWTLPAGFMENGETTADAARREADEEAGARVIVDAPFTMVSIAHINQVHPLSRPAGCCQLRARRGEPRSCPGPAGEHPVAGHRFPQRDALP